MSIIRPRTPLTGGLPLVRPRAPKAHKRRATGFSPAVHELIRQRSQGHCEVCDTREFWPQHHHRRPRGAGGTRRESTNEASNGLALCGPCHALIESHRNWALVHGWLVNQNADPRLVKVLTRHGWVRLTDAGSMEAA